jgi:DNA-binding NarL/FixJ family response regulator
MTAAIETIEACCSFTGAIEDRRLRVVVADGSRQYVDVVFALLEFNDVVDLIGRAANFEETIHLAVNHQPDIVLIDLEMASASLAIAAITLSARHSVMIVGMSAAEPIPLHALGAVTSVDALVHKACLRREFLPVVGVLYGCAAALTDLSGQPRPHPNSEQWTEMQFHKTAN